jgi:hypothetical protein
MCTHARNESNHSQRNNTHRTHPEGARVHKSLLGVAGTYVHAGYGVAVSLWLAVSAILLLL